MMTTPITVDELTTPVMLAEIQRMAPRSLTIIINEFLDDNQSIHDAVAMMLNADMMDTERADEFIASGTIVQITVNGQEDGDTIDIIGPTLDDAIGNMYFYLKAEE